MTKRHSPKFFVLFLSLCCILFFSSAFVFLPFATMRINMSLDEDAKVISLTDENGYHYIMGTFYDKASSDLQTDIFIRKLNEDFSKQLFEIRYGGTSNEYLIDAICQDNKLYLCGSTQSPDLHTTDDALFSQALGWGDGFVAVFDLEGKLQFGSYIGGDSTDFCSSLCIEKGQMHITGTTWSEQFPITPDAFQKRLYGITDAFYMRILISPPTIEYSTYLGGSGEEFCEAICVYNAEPILFGRTSSHDFFLTQNSYNQSFNGGEWDLFLVSLSDGIPAYSTYLGGSRNDFASTMELSPEGLVYFTGRTYSPNYPITPNAFQLELKGLSDGFISTINTSTYSLEFSSFFGGSKTEYPESITFAGSVPVVTGRTFSEHQFPVTPNALQKRFAGGWSDGFLFCMSATDHSLLYSSYLGGNDRDSLDSIVWSGQSNQIVLSGRTMSSEIPTRAISYVLDHTENQMWNGFVLKYWLPIP